MRECDDCVSWNDGCGFIEFDLCPTGQSIYDALPDDADLVKDAPEVDDAER
jgi:hypothetical protein